MAEELGVIVQSLLRGSEEVKIALETRILSIQSQESSDDDDSVLRTEERIWDSRERKRILAVVTHLDSASGDEQGCAFIFKSKPLRPHSTVESYTIEYVLPILGRFSISMAQPRRNTLDLRQSTSTSLNQPRTELTLTVHPAYDSTIEPIELLTRDTQHLRAVLAECKRLKELAAANSEPGMIPSYSWIVPYTTTSQPAILSLIPPDLRHAHRPLFTILSPATAGQPGDDVFDISLIREDWFKTKLHEEFSASPNFSLRVRVGTFNVNGNLPSQDLSPWVRGREDQNHVIPPLKDISPLSIGTIAKDSSDYMNTTTGREQSGTLSMAETASTTAETAASSSSLKTIATTPADHPFRADKDPDLLVLGFQELDLSAEALLYSTKTDREEAWCTAVLAGLGEKAEEYQKLASKQLVGMLLVAFVKKEKFDNFTDAKATSVGAGILGLMGNKGATALRLKFVPPSTTEVPSPRPVVLTFVNAHLAAFDEMFDRRNLDFHDLSKRLLFDSGIPAQDTEGQTDGYSPITMPLTVFQSDALFWMGDLNYRINLPDADVRALLSEDSMSDVLLTLLRYDQLKLAMRTNKAFSNFTEHSIIYPPSYRFSSRGSADDLGYDMKRKPAWTDRILHMNSPAAHIEHLRYSSHPEITMSDHRPVSADFHVHVPVVDQEKIESFIQTLWRDVADFENSEEPPQIRVTNSTLDFGNVHYKRPVARALELKNVGKVPCTFRFVPVAEGAPIIPDWLKIDPMSGLIRPEEVISITFSAAVDNTVAHRLNAGSGRLEDTLILHTSLGKDHFISVVGQYQRTCFATSFDRLVRLPGPIRSPQSLSLLPESRAVNTPREVMRLIDWLMSNAINIKELFLTPGDKNLVSDIRECLDTGADFSSPSSEDGTRVALAFASCLLELLQSLPDPLVPVSMHARCAQVQDRDQAFELLGELPSAAVNTFVPITAMLHLFIMQGASDYSSDLAEKLSNVFALILLRDDPNSATPASPLGRRKFLLYFIQVP